jgi:hypothetical protein
METETETDDLLARANKEIIEGLVAQWNQINQQIDRYGWDEDSRALEHDFYADQFQESLFEEIDLLEQRLGRKLTSEEKGDLRERVRAQVEDRQDAHILALHAKRDALEQVLATLGARMMRPYEHWNEEESFMQWSEEDQW